MENVKKDTSGTSVADRNLESPIGRPVESYRDPCDSMRILINIIFDQFKYSKELTFLLVGLYLKIPSTHTFDFCVLCFVYRHLYVLSWTGSEEAGGTVLRMLECMLPRGPIGAAHMMSREREKWCDLVFEEGAQNIVTVYNLYRKYATLKHRYDYRRSWIKAINFREDLSEIIQRSFWIAKNQIFLRLDRTNSLRYMLREFSVLYTWN